MKLSDAAIAVLKEHKLNNRLVSELLAHPTAPQLFSVMEVYIDRKILPQMNTMNAVYKAAEEAIRERYGAADGDGYIKILQEAVVDEDEYLRFRITERFSILMKALFDAHKKDALSGEQTDVLNELKGGYKTYLENKETATSQRARFALLAKQIGLNVARLTDEEIKVLMKALQDSDLYKKSRRRK